MLRGEGGLWLWGGTIPLFTLLVSFLHKTGFQCKEQSLAKKDLEKIISLLREVDRSLTGKGGAGHERMTSVSLGVRACSALLSNAAIQVPIRAREGDEFKSGHWSALVLYSSVFSSASERC